MALATYSDLQSAILNWPDLAGEDDLTASIDDIITLAEERISRTVRIQGILAAVNESGSGPYQQYALPADFLEIDQVFDNEGFSLTFVPRDELTRESYVVLDKTFYSIVGRELQFWPAVEEFSFSYYQKQQPLSVVDTHYLYAKSPGLYLYAGLIEAAIFSKETEQEIARYTSRYQEIVGELLAEDQAWKYPRSQPLRASVGLRGQRRATA